ncbi:hypothetical protein L1987_53919 [Smallanthus sonchifolius]|uniref:Uncharacterized protein n=1 Tax=Smallanthus sonchifolius TaxID=185202 RepID=A0ACB9E5T3_9ASTR|nr:hypothetical protein L1987_53919 [Smallanthus sonchifolius]
MEGFEKAIGSKGASATVTNSSGSSLLLTRPPRRAVSLWTCSKLCGVCFIAGVIVGFTLKRRVRRWAATLLRRIKDD